MAAKKKGTKKGTKKTAAKKANRTKAFGQVKGGALIGVAGPAHDGTPSKALERAFDNLRRVLRTERVNLVGVIEDVQGKRAVVATAREPNTIPSVIQWAQVLSGVAADLAAGKGAKPASEPKTEVADEVVPEPTTTDSGEAAAATAASDSSPEPAPEAPADAPLNAA